MTAKTKFGKCQECGELLWNVKDKLCFECEARKKSNIVGSGTGDTPKLRGLDDYDEQDWIVDRLMTTPQRNAHKFDWPD